MGLAALAGVLSTIGLLASPIGAAVPPLVPPKVPIDLRFVSLPLTYVLTLVVGANTRWPGPPAGVLTLALGSALTANLHSSASLAYTGVDWADEGRIDLVALFATVAAVLLALLIALELARERFVRAAVRAGVPEEEANAARSRGTALIQGSLATSALAVAVLAFVARIVIEFSGERRLPLPEVFALAVVLAVAAVMMGVRGIGREG
jgi:hypothetical protein